MKTAILLLVSLAALASAQMTIPAGCTPTPGCPTSTITGTITSTYCSVCEAAKATGGIYTTTYATVYVDVCPTGLTSSSYTVTETCTGSAICPCTTAPPPGFTTTKTVCTACEGQPTVTVTYRPTNNAAATAAPAANNPAPANNAANNLAPMNNAANTAAVATATTSAGYAVFTGAASLNTISGAMARAVVGLIAVFVF